MLQQVPAARSRLTATKGSEDHILEIFWPVRRPEHQRFWQPRTTGADNREDHPGLRSVLDVVKTRNGISGGVPSPSCDLRLDVICSWDNEGRSSGHLIDVSIVDHDSALARTRFSGESWAPPIGPSSSELPTSLVLSQALFHKLEISSFEPMRRKTDRSSTILDDDVVKETADCSTRGSVKPKGSSFAPDYISACVDQAAGQMRIIV